MVKTKSIPKSKTYKYCEKRKSNTPNKTKECIKLCHSVSAKGYVYTDSSWKTHCKKRQWYSPDRYKYTAKEINMNKERYNKSLPKQKGGSCKRRRVRKMKDGTFNQKDIEHNQKCQDKYMLEDNPWMLEKSALKITKKLYPKLIKKRSKVNKEKERKQRYYNRKKKRTTRKSKAPTEEAYLEYRDGKSNKFWRISKSGSKIKTSWGKIGTSGSSQEKDYGDKSDTEYKKLISSKKKKGYKEKDGGGGLDGYNRELESLWKDMSNSKKLVFIMKDKSYKIMRTSRSKYESLIEKGNNDSDVKAILTAGNSYDGYIHLYAKAQNKSVDDVLKNYKKYWKHPMDNKLLIC